MIFCTRAASPKFRLRFSERLISYWAARYSDAGDALIENRIGPGARARGYLTRAAFLQIAEWKTPRSRPLCVRNSAPLVRKVTYAALSTRDEELKMDSPERRDVVSSAVAAAAKEFCGVQEPFLGPL